MQRKKNEESRGFNEVSQRDLRYGIWSSKDENSKVKKKIEEQELKRKESGELVCLSHASHTVSS